MTGQDPLAPALRTTLRSALATLKRSTNLPLVFSGSVLPSASGRAGRVQLIDFVGSHTGALAKLELAPCSGLGGRAAGSGRPQFVADYQDSRLISHEYDAQVDREGLKPVCALPVITHGAVLAVIYLATREGVLGDRVLRQSDAFIRTLGRGLEDPGASGGADIDIRSTIDAVAVLDEIIGGIAHPRSRKRLAAVRRHLAADLAPVPDGAFALTPRELDVLRLVARGRTNPQIGDALGLCEQTIKSYLNNAMRKLGVRSNRTAAAHLVRAAGLL